MKVRRLEVGQLKANCYLLIESEKCVIVDPGDDADYIERVISDEEVTPHAIILTHGHFDHVLASTELKLAYNIPMLMNSEDLFLLKNAKKSAEHFTDVKALPITKINTDLKGKRRLDIIGIDFELIPTPGHTPGSISLYIKDDNLLFVGDVVFEGGYVGRTDFKYANAVDLRKSISELLKLPVETTVYSGHGDVTNIGDLKLLINDH